MIGWDTDTIRIWVVNQTRECMFLLVETLDRKTKSFYTVVCVSNPGGERKDIWRSLKDQKHILNGNTWAIAGDFNVTLEVNEHPNESSFSSNDMKEFQECINESLKSPLNKLSWEKGDVFDRVKRYRCELKEIQCAMEQDPNNETLRNKSCELLIKYNEAKKEDIILHQKAKVEWLNEGDRNTFFFHKVLKDRKHKGRIMAICDESGNRFENEEVADQFLKHFKEFLGNQDKVEPMDKYMDNFDCKLSMEESNDMVKEVSNKEVKDALFDIEDDKVHEWLYFKKFQKDMGYSWPGCLQSCAGIFHLRETTLTIFSLRIKVRENIRFVVGSRKNTSAWYDNWHPMGPLSNVISIRDVYDARLSDQCTVDEAIERGVWKWPNEWFGRYPILNNYGVPHLNKYRRDIGRLLTQDRVLRWKPNEDLKCPLCEECNDSHEHLFFTLTKLVCGATVYYIWNERNARLFGSNKRNEEAICHEIEDTVRLRLVNLKVKESNAVRNVEKLWKIKLQRCNIPIFGLRSGNYNGCY
ncbi:hypothetical protein Tco_1004323 [Tanacetum coccineum]|uniref:Uncharacterized protein n=1 Tax=Tanacetum coccineum TaxID=301880 RepID=A0ABQ5FBT0_9ASTR